MANPLASLNGKRSQFKKGNKLGRGNPLIRQVNQFRAALVKAVTREDIRQIMQAMLERAKKGDTAAAKEIFDRLFGKSKQPIALTGSAAKAAKSISKLFDHAGYAALFRQSGSAKSPNGQRTAAADDN